MYDNEWIDGVDAWIGVQFKVNDEPATNIFANEPFTMWNVLLSDIYFCWLLHDCSS